MGGDRRESVAAVRSKVARDWMWTKMLNPALQPPEVHRSRNAMSQGFRAMDGPGKAGAEKRGEDASKEGRSPARC